jgi:hypothetical protein
MIGRLRFLFALRVISPAPLFVIVSRILDFATPGVHAELVEFAMVSRALAMMRAMNADVKDSQRMLPQ